MDLTVLPNEIENIVICYLHQMNFLPSLNIIENINIYRTSRFILSRFPYARAHSLKWWYINKNLNRMIYIINGYPLSNVSYYCGKTGDFFKHNELAEAYIHTLVL